MKLLFIQGFKNARDWTDLDDQYEVQSLIEGWNEQSMFRQKY